jgi:hypothetical protein
MNLNTNERQHSLQLHGFKNGCNAESSCMKELTTNPE